MTGISLRASSMRSQLSAVALAIGLASAASSPAHGQGNAGSDTGSSAATSDKSKSDDQGDIIITGSRLARSTFNSTSPVTVLDQKDIENLNLNNVGEVVAQLPANSNFFAGNNVGLGNFNVGAQLVNLRGLNPFFGTRTLTLVDGRRVVPTTTGGGVDITLIPSMLVDRTETVTGGASAVYGSDAVAGVVNIILDTKLVGFKGQTDFSRTTYGDGNDWHASLAWGGSFAGGAGHIVLGGEYDNQDAIGICSKERPWCGTSYGLFTNTGYLTNGQPHYIVGMNATNGNSSLTGMLVPCTAFVGVCVNVPPVSGGRLEFNAAGSALSPYTPGGYSDGAGFFGFQQGGDSVGAYDTTTMRPQVKRWSTLGHVSYEFGSVNAFIEGSYARSRAVNPVANGAIGPYALEVASDVFAGFRIAPDNAYLTPAEATAIGPNGAEFGRSMANVQNARNETNNDTFRIVAGLDGKLAGSWDWDFSFEHGVNKNNQHLYHSVVSTFLNYALDAVNNGSGQIVCGVTIPGRINPNTGAPYTATDVANAASGGTCVPLNLFGVGNASQAAIDYAFRELKERSSYTQDDAALNLRGNLLQGWGAGPVKLATGLEYRRERGEVYHDLANQPWYTYYTLSYGLDYAGTTEVFEGYGEVNVPVFKDAPIGKYLELDGAIRETNNRNKQTLGQQAGQSASHDFMTWKLSGIWDLTDWLRLRGTRSRDVRAAQFRELNSAYAVAAGGPFGTVQNPFPGGSAADQALISSGGDINLQPEKADTLTIGAVVQPKSGFLSGLRFSADWYQIKISDAIVGPPFGLGAQNIVSLCNGIGAFCDRLTFTQPGDPGYDPTHPQADIATINNTAVNLQGFTTRGVDFELAYSKPMSSLRSDWGGTLTVRVLASYLYDQLFSSGLLGSQVYNYAGQSGPTGAFGSFNTTPNWQGNAFLTYTGGRFSGTVQLRYVGPGRYLTTTASGGLAVAPGDPGYSTTNPNSINENHVDQAIYTNVSASWDMTKHFQIFGSVNNLFDKDPPIAPGGNGYPTNPVYFDTYGRTWRIGIRAKY